jgi:hypothetical protein
MSPSQRPLPYTGPWYQGFIFVLVSSTPGKPNHILTISQQFNEPWGEKAYITGSWVGENPSGQMSPKSFQGLIAQNGNHISCSWPSPGGSNQLAGSLTYTPGEFIPKRGLIWPSAFIDGEVTDQDGQPAGPGHVTGTGTRPWVAAPWAATQ